MPGIIRSPWDHPLWSPLEKALYCLEKWRLNDRNQAAAIQDGTGQGNQNIDPGELLRFEAAAHEWWDPKGPSGALHAINPLRLRFITDGGSIEGQRVLDVGCGGGLLSEALARRGACVTGIDRGRTALNVARRHARAQGLVIDYQQGTAESWARNHANHYDLVVCMELLEHVPDGGSVIKACATMAKHGGRVVFATLNRNVKSYVFAILGGEYILKLLYYFLWKHQMILVLKMLQKKYCLSVIIALYIMAMVLRLRSMVLLTMKYMKCSMENRYG